MGSNTSKPNDTAVLTLKNDLDMCGNSDPRSPTPEIVRTPLQNKNGGKHNITKNVDLRKTFETAIDDEKLIHNNPILSAVIKNHLQSYDPRSPTQDFERTPIIITSKIEGLSEIMQQNNCASPVLQNDDDNNYDACAEAYEISPQLIVPKNLCDGFNDMSLNDTLKESQEPLGSSTASNEAIEENTTHVSESKPRKLLETNFDYMEYNNDIFEDSHENNQEEIDKTDDLNCVPVFKILDDDPRSPSIGIERTPIVVAKMDENTSEVNIEDMSDDTLIKVLQNTNVELRQSVSKPTDKTPEGLLVYEDDTANLCDTPKKTKSANNSGSRTPLSCMKNKTDAAHARSKSANMLYDPKDQKICPSKIPKRVSHIPRLKSLCKQSKLTPTMSSISLKNISKTSVMGGDCENTPPHSHRDIWDKDNSIVL
ncbi:hypothetical protein K1T71_001960 [Dendrolimus kikuchii]|uniref:Uncharacterized protein n=1 Tax=Dendrolimus kikuchii TaxID=765133 RepID=A0ACC1DFE3_9NEOP|nr:hypothetical protein K1T71_001960 [Dendrolimus kikuchii]